MKFKRVVRKSRTIAKDIALYVCIVVLFFGGYIYSNNYIAKEFSDEQYEVCKEIIHDIYEQGENVIVDMPSTMYYEEEAGELEVGFEGYYGYAKATFVNNKLVVEKVENDERIALSIFCGLLLIVFGIVLKFFIYCIYKKAKNME